MSGLSHMNMWKFDRVRMFSILYKKMCSYSISNSWALMNLYTSQCASSNAFWSLGRINPIFLIILGIFLVRIAISRCVNKEYTTFERIFISKSHSFWIKKNWYWRSGYHSINCGLFSPFKTIKKINFEITSFQAVSIGYLVQNSSINIYHTFWFDELRTL